MWRRSKRANDGYKSKFLTVKKLSKIFSSENVGPNLELKIFILGKFWRKN